MSLSRHRSVCLALSLTLVSTRIVAAGLEYPWQSTSAMGTAQANAAEAADASTVYFNPAGMVRLRGTMVSQSGQLIAARGHFQDDGTTRLEHGQEVPVSGGGQGSYFPAVIPGGQFYAVTPYNDTITLGLGIFVPVGANINYKSDWTGRFFQDEGALESVNINPSLAIRFDDKHSLGFGVSAQILHMRLRAGVDVQEGAWGIGKRTIQTGLSQLCDSKGLPLVGGITSTACGQLAGLVAGPLVADGDGEGSLRVEGVGYGFGWNMGYLYRFNNDRTRFGLTYRSLIRQTIHADADWDFSQVTGTIPDITGVNRGDPLSLLGALTGRINLREYTEQYVRPDTDASIKVVTPETVGLSLYHEATDRLALMTSLTWAHTSRVQELRIRFDDQPGPNGTVSQGDAVVRMRFRDAVKAAVGVNYRWNEKLMLRSGIGFEQTPVPDAEARHASIPDANRYVFTLGANYKPRRNLDIDLAYGYIMLEDSVANYHDDCHPSGYIPSQTGSGDIGPADECTGNGGTFKGHYSNSYVNSLGVQINQHF
ncbi:MAG: outer membrane protein transport protein [Perlucidibaca sp.]